MKSIKKGIVIFDLDGTLHHTEKALVPAIQKSMEDMGFPPAEPEAINALYGEPLDVFCEKLMGSAEYCERFREGIRKHQAVTLPVSGSLYPGTIQMLTELKNKGYDLAVCSNAGVDYIHLVTESLNVSEFFSTLSGWEGDGSKTERVSRLIEVSQGPLCVMVGDRYHDIAAAAENGILSVGCRYGYGDEQELAGADFIIESPSDLPMIISELEDNPISLH